MIGIDTPERFLWALTMLLAAVLVMVGLWRKSYRAHPFFFIYVLAFLAQNLVLAVSYRLWGFGSVISYRIAWGTQIGIVMVRALAVVEICRRTLRNYPGIWALGQRIFLAIAALVLVYSWAVGGHNWQLATLTLDRGLELAMATSLLGLFLFVAYYQVPVGSADRLLAIGFFLYSCVLVLNNTILERWLTRYATLWNLVGTGSFLGSLVLWNWALGRAQPRRSIEPQLLPGNHYRSLSPAINARLNSLNDRLCNFWRAEGENT